MEKEIELSDSKKPRKLIKVNDILVEKFTPTH